MTEKERENAFLSLERKHKEETETMEEVVSEAQDLIHNLYRAKEEGKVKIGVADAINIDEYYEKILAAKCHLAKILLALIDLKEDGTQEDFTFVLYRMAKTRKSAECKLENIKDIIDEMD